MGSNNADTTGAASVSGQAFGGNFSFLNVGPMASADVQRIGPGFDPALGYLAEANVLRGKGTAGWWHRTSGGANVIPAVDWSFRRTLDGRERSLLLNPEVEYSTPAGDFILAEVFFEQDKLASGYAPVPGTWLAPGSYRWTYLYSVLETSPSRPWWVSAELRTGGYYNGRRNDQTAFVAWKPSPQWEARASVGRNAISLPTGAFTVKLATLRVDHTPSTRLSESLLLQWDNVSQSLGVSARLRWLWAPGRELIFSLDRLGYTGERRTLEQQQTRAVLKLVWSFER